MISSFFSKFLVKFLKNSIKYKVSRAVLGALSGVLKVALLRAMTIQGESSDDSCKRGKNEYAALKLMGLGRFFSKLKLMG